jgi:hypothetical protein
VADLWMPGATRADVGDHAPCDTQYPPKAIAHITWDRNATAAQPQDLVPYSNLKMYFTGAGKAMAPHILWDPFEGRFTQFYPADSRSKSLADAAGGTRTNRAGKVVLQIEALFFPYCRYGGKVYPRLVDTPCKGWDQLHAWIKSWGVPDAWPNGRPESCTRNETNWETKAGWYPHKGVPENTHTDPLTWPAFPVKEDPMALTDADAKKVAEAVWAKLLESPTAPEGTNPLRSAGTFLRWGDQHHKEVMTRLAALEAAVKGLSAQK